jgi:DNA-binding response OmpR family regulator
VAPAPDEDPPSSWILVIEDNPLAASALRILLQDAGYDVVTAGSLAEAERAATDARSPAAAALLDLTLPDGDGLLLLPRLSAIGRLPRVVLALTGRDDPETRARCLAAGCGDVLLKPVPARELPKIVARWIDE